MPNPLATKVWEEWCRQYEQDLAAAAAAERSDRQWEFAGSDDGEPGSRRSSVGSNNSWMSQREAPAPPEISPIHWPPMPRLDSPGDVLPPEQRSFTEYPLPPSMPLPTVGYAALFEPDENTIRYGGLNAEYYGGSNMEGITSADLVPWHVTRQGKKRTRRGVKRTDSWTLGRGSKRHVFVITKTAEEPEEDGPKSRRGESLDE